MDVVVQQKSASVAQTKSLQRSSKNPIAAESFAALLQKISYLGHSGVTQVRLAYDYADAAHAGQMRSSGDPYITHPIAVAALCADWKLDAQALMAALLHDAMEDCGITKADLGGRFGMPVAELVDGLTKLDKLQFNTREENQSESFRKMLLAMARDVRVILIKLADRTHNMRTLGDMPRSKWWRISSETLEIYAPIAHRLGLNQTYRELQDLAFRHLHPWRHAILEKALNRTRNRSRDIVHKVQTEVAAAFARHGMLVHLYGREKNLFAIYRKMDSQHLSFANVTDLYGFRIIAPTVTDCYTALGVLHQIYKPVPGKFKDHIAIAKLNGYQSLHTTVVGPAGQSVEFQVRTPDMHMVAESGVAAYWLYTGEETDSNDSTAGKRGSQWLQSLLDIQNETRDAAEFWEHIKIDLFPDAVYVFTPRNKVLALPRGATVVDFAYAIHSDVGHRTVQAYVNNEQVPLRTELQNGDVVKVITEKGARPNPAWQAFVRTGRARSKISHYLENIKQTESADLGEKLLLQALRAEGMQELPAVHAPLWDKLLHFTGHRSRAELMTDLGRGKRVASIVAKRLVPLLTQGGLRPDALLLTRERYSSHENLSQGSITLDGSENASVHYAPCCRPVPGEPVLGYLGHGEGLFVHHAHCGTALKLQHKDAERFIAVDWADEPARLFETAVTVTVSNGKGVLARIAAGMTSAEADILRIDMGEALDAVDLRFVIAVRDATHLDAVLRSLRHMHPVLRAFRVLPARPTA